MIPTFKEVLPIYIPHLERDPYWAPVEDVVAEGTQGRYLTTLAVAFIIAGTPEDAKLGWEVIDILLDYGFDFSKRDPGHANMSPLEICKENKKLYSYILNRALEQPATEAVAYEAGGKWFLNRLKGLAKPFIDAANDVKNSQSTVGKIASGATYGLNAGARAVSGLAKAGVNAAGKVLSVPGRLATKLSKGKGESEEDKATYDKYSKKNTEVQEGEYRQTGKSPVELDKMFAELSPSEKYLFVLDNLPEGIYEPKATDSQDILAKSLTKKDKPFTSLLYKVLEKFGSDPGQKDKISPTVAGILTNPKFSTNLTKVLDKYGIKGLMPLDSEEGLGQLKIITFFAFKNWAVEKIRVKTPSQWKRLGPMKTVVEQTELGIEGGKPKWKKLEIEDIKKYWDKLMNSSSDITFKIDEPPKTWADLVKTIKGIAESYGRSIELPFRVNPRAVREFYQRDLIKRKIPFVQVILNEKKRLEKNG